MPTHGGDDGGIEVIASHRVHEVERPLERVRRLVIARRGQGVEDIGRRNDPRAKEDLLRRQTPRVALSVHTLVMLRGNDRDVAHVLREDEVREELTGLLGVLLHVLELGLVELSRLEQELIGNRDLAVVVD